MSYEATAGKLKLIKNEKQIVNAALGLLEQELILPGLCYRSSAFDFSGALGDVVMVKRPSRGVEANDFGLRQTKAIEPGQVKESKMPVRLTQYPGNALHISDEQLDLDIASFGAQILAPQVRGMAEYVDDQVALAMIKHFKTDAATNGVTVVDADLSVATDDTARARVLRNALIDARTAMNKAAVPRVGRVIVTTPDITAILLKDPEFQGADWSGTTAALREATIGRLYGFDIVESNTLAAHDPHAMFALTPTALVLATFAPKVPQGAVFGSGASANGTALRWLMDYDADALTDRSILSTYMGITPVREDDSTNTTTGSDEAGSIKRAVCINVTVTASP